MAVNLGAVDLSQNHYDVLEVNARTVTQADMKRNYRRLCLKYHPDKGGPQATDQFHRVKVAYDTLSDARKKVQFDHAYFYARHSAPRNFKRIPEPSPVEPSSKRPRVVPRGAAASAASSSGTNSPSESISGSVSPPSEDVTLDLAAMSITKLKSMAKARGIDISTCIEKADITAAIRKAYSSGSGPAGAEGSANKKGKRDGSTDAASEAPEPPTENLSSRGPATEPTGAENGSYRSRLAAYAKEIEGHKSEIGLSSESLGVSTGIVERLSRLQRMLDSSAAYATDHSCKRARSTASPRGRFGSAIQNHLGSLVSGANAMDEVKKALANLSDRLRGVMKDIKRSDAELIVSTRGISSEIRRYQELTRKLSKEGETKESTASSDEPSGGSGRKQEAATDAGGKDSKKMNINRLAGFKDVDGTLPFESGRSWADLLAPGARLPQAKGDTKTPVSGASTKRRESAHKGRGRLSSATASTATGSLFPGGVEPAQRTETSQGGGDTMKVERVGQERSDHGGNITVRIPESWKPGRRVQFNTEFGVVRFVPPGSSGPGDLMTFDPSTRMVRRRPSSSSRRPPVDPPKVVWEDGKEFVLLD
ncbi:hypothetical protein FOZ63_008858 [Perkinsus olseni]|uniref:J domain-containing protein n=1 Tax=Perkinsus olseni TaxID=32597 RepID=A0A7J6RCD6_PEROL|nr:hypothetical protein FOZ63_008858 [Perkinsus olseni]